MPRTGVLGVSKGLRDHSRQAGERNDVEDVVLEHRHQTMPPLGPQVLEVDVRDHLAGNVTVPFYAEDLGFQVNETAVFEAELEQPPSPVEQVQMLHFGERMPLPAHRVTGFEQRLVVAFPVIGDQHIEARQMFCQGVQGGGFFGVIPHEELADQEALILNAPEADEKCAGARTPGQTGGLGVQKSPLAGMHFADGPIGQRVQQVMRQVFQGGDFVAAVPLVPGI